METIMQVLSDTRYVWLPVAVGVAVWAFVRVVGDLLARIRADLRG